MPKNFFLVLTSQKQSIVLNQKLQTNHIELKGYTIRGAPTTGGDPDYSYYLIDFNFRQSSWIKGGHTVDALRDGIPLILQGEYTHEHPPEGFVVCDEYVNIGQMNVEVKTPDGGPAVFTEIVLLLQAK
jgi:hypothetical protein